MQILTLIAVIMGMAVLAVMALVPLVADLPLAPARGPAVPTAAPPSRPRCDTRRGGAVARAATTSAA